MKPVADNGAASLVILERRTCRWRREPNGFLDSEQSEVRSRERAGGAASGNEGVEGRKHAPSWLGKDVDDK